MNPFLVIAVLSQVAASESIVVTATRTGTRIADTPGSVLVLSKKTLDSTAALTIDDALRQVPGFTLFRRAGSRVANPTTQGVSLRGIGAGGASRALVLDDGVPLNDPFGGWIYWGRVPREALERVEVLRGGASDLYGSSAMGGVVQFIRRTGPQVSARISAGSEQTGDSSAFASVGRGDWNGSIAADALTTAGYVLVRPDQRGSVDVNADSRHTNIEATIRHGSAFFRAAHYREARANGTPLQQNDTTIRQLSVGSDGKLGHGLVTLRAYASDQDYFQTFSSVAAGRNSERLTIEQNVPSHGSGGNGQWTRTVGKRQVLVAGAELRAAGGRSDERRFSATNGPISVTAGGRQETAAVYIEDLFAVTPSLSITAGARADGWRNHGSDTRVQEVQVNPRLSVLWRLSDALTLTGSAYTAFRSPTLNELYRGFRVGNVNTLPNAQLQSEGMTGFELGGRARNVRLTLFSMDVSHTIANVTLGSSGGTITRQRQNLGQTRSRGAEVDADWTLRSDWRISAGLLYVDATVQDGALEGKRLPQVPRQQATAQVMWRNAGVQLRWSARQYDDDRNELPLRGYAIADLFASHSLSRSVDLTIAIENALNRQVEVSATPVVTLGQPRAWRIGLRYAP